MHVPYGGGKNGGGGGGTAGQEVLFDIMHGFLPRALIIRLFCATSLDGKAVVPGKIKVARMRHRRLAIGMGEHRRFTVVNHNLSGHAVKIFKSVLVAGQEVFLRLRQRELDIHPGGCNREP